MAVYFGRDDVPRTALLGGSLEVEVYYRLVAPLTAEVEGRVEGGDHLPTKHGLENGAPPLHNRVVVEVREGQ